MTAFLEAFWPFIALAVLIGGIFWLSRRPKRHDVRSGGDYADSEFRGGSRKSSDWGDGDGGGGGSD